MGRAKDPQKHIQGRVEEAIVPPVGQSAAELPQAQQTIPAAGGEPASPFAAYAEVAVPLPIETPLTYALPEGLRELALPDLRAYRAHLERNTPEWGVLDTLCWIPISRFYRDKAVFAWLEHAVLPALATRAMARGETELRCWSAGCAAGEEPYTLAMIWRLRVASAFPALRLRVVATDVDPAMIARARAGCYPAHSVKNVPADIVAEAFRRAPAGYSVREEFRGGIEFLVQDIRLAMPGERFHLILCRNVVLTYFDETLQRAILRQMMQRLLPCGAVIFGLSEALPEGVRLEPWSPRLRVYRHRGGVATPGEAAGPHPEASAGCASVDFSIT